MTSTPEELRILVVDPATSSRTLTRKLLAGAGYSVLEVPSGRDALAYLIAPGAPRVDAILKAHDPPASNGPRFLQKLKDSGLGKDLPVISEPPPPLPLPLPFHLVSPPFSPI